MRIAIPTDGETGLNELVGQHFGRVRNYTIVDSETNETTILPNTSHHMGGVGYPPELLAEAGVDTLLCSGLGRRAIQMFQEKGVHVHVSAHGTVKDAIESWKRGELVEATDENACRRHAFRGEKYGSNCHGKHG